ncbi:MAG: class I SAM-dependent methyltransferase [Candidatus Wildermuthbacteria bacterium]|nr:class I SAM-dependent methyltransferase [Candidatus Wildermuthbacteria bacterium]
MAVKQVSNQTGVSARASSFEFQDGLRFETQRWPYLLSLPFMWLLTFWVMAKKTLLKQKPHTNAYWFDGISEVCRKIKEGAASWRALDIIYNHNFGKDGKITDFWLGMMNAQAVRNRKRLVTSLLIQNLRAMAKGQELRILSLASGSAQSVIEALSVLKEEKIVVRAVLADKDPTALENSKWLAHCYGVQNQITLLQKDIVRGLLKQERPFENYGPFDVVEMVGFLEYAGDRLIVELMKSIHSLLAPGGIFLTSTIGNNPERFFLHWVINWKMIYRSREALQALVAAGFKQNHCAILSEPLSIFHVAICRKIVESQG